MEKEFTFEIVKFLGVLSSGKNGWTKEVNLISWSGGKPKVDIRSWSPDHNQMSKGVSLNDEEVKLLLQFIDKALE